MYAIQVRRPSTGIEVLAPMTSPQAEILTTAALGFLADLERRTRARRRELLAARQRRQERLDAGEMPDFLAETADIRRSDWRIAPVPAELADRRVEITGPVDRKMVINALNSARRCTWPISRTRTPPRGAPRSTGKSICATRSPARSTTRAPQASTTPSARVRPRSWCGRAAGISTRSTC